MITTVNVKLSYSHSQNYNNDEYGIDKECAMFWPLCLCYWRKTLLKDSTAIAQSLSFNFVLHISPITFLGDGSSGPLSLCPEVKYNHPFQNPTRVVFTRNGNFPITDHFWELITAEINNQWQKNSMMLLFATVCHHVSSYHIYTLYNLISSNPNINATENQQGPRMWTWN